MVSSFNPFSVEKEHFFKTRNNQICPNGLNPPTRFSLPSFPRKCYMESNDQKSHEPSIFCRINVQMLERKIMSSSLEQHDIRNRFE